MMIHLRTLPQPLRQPVWQHIQTHTPTVAEDLKNNGLIKQFIDAFDASLEVDSSLMHPDLESQLASHNLKQAFESL